MKIARRLLTEYDIEGLHKHVMHAHILTWRNVVWGWIAVTQGDVNSCYRHAVIIKAVKCMLCMYLLYCMWVLSNGACGAQIYLLEETEFHLHTFMHFKIAHKNSMFLLSTLSHNCKSKMKKCKKCTKANLHLSSLGR